jgi:uncharacterized glyoxalase superfamily protein PhnB
VALKLGTDGADNMLNSLRTALAAGKIRLYSGTEPTTANTALSGNTLLAEFTFGSPAFTVSAASGSDRAITATAISSTTALADGTATFFRVLDAAGTLTYYQGTVGTSGQQLTLTATNIVTSGTVTISSLSITMPLT